MPAPEWEIPTNLQPDPDDYEFDLERTLRSVVGLRANVPSDAFTAGTLGTERTGNGVIIRADGLVLTIGYLVTEAETVWLITADGRVLTGLLVEDSPQRVVLKTQGGKLETVPRDDVEESRISKLSLMPEGVEDQLKPQELADLFAFLILDRPPEDPEAKPIPAK